MAFFVVLQQIMKILENQTTTSKITAEGSLQFTRLKTTFDITLGLTELEVISTKIKVRQIKSQQLF
jgi:hypothetical protein